MTEYHLILHVGQGDSFSEFLDQSNNNAQLALAKWANDFRTMANVCDELSLKINSENVDIVADGHSIVFVPKDNAGTVVLDELTDKAILDKFEYVDNMIDEDTLHDDTLANL